MSNGSAVVLIVTGVAQRYDEERPNSGTSHRMISEGASINSRVHEKLYSRVISYYYCGGTIAYPVIVVELCAC